MEYRRASTEADIKKLLYIFENCFTHLRAHIDDLDPYAEKLEKYAEVYSLWNNDVLIGLAVFYANDLKSGYGYISLIGLLPEYRRHGYGTKLLQFCEGKMRQAGLKMLKLEVDDDNLSAQSFYRYMGLYETARASGTSSYMEKSLS